jgi:hypothetical protein
MHIYARLYTKRTLILLECAMCVTVMEYFATRCSMKEAGRGCVQISDCGRAKKLVGHTCMSRYFPSSFLSCGCGHGWVGASGL